MNVIGLLIHLLIISHVLRKPDCGESTESEFVKDSVPRLIKVVGAYTKCITKMNGVIASRFVPPHVFNIFPVEVKVVKR